MKREKVIIDVDVLIELIRTGWYDIEGTLNWEVIDTILNSCDNEDGGGYYTLILKRISDNKFFSVDYTDWDLNNTDNFKEDGDYGKYGRRVDLCNELEEVFPVEKIITVYE